MSLSCLLNLAVALVAAPGVERDPRCGGYTLYVGLTALGVELGDYGTLEEKLGEPPLAGYSLGQLASAAESYGLHTLGVQTSVENLARRPGRFVCIAHIRGDHFVNVIDVQQGIVSVVDPPREYTMPADTFNTRWDGTALLISPEPLLREEDLPRPFPWRWLVGIAIAALAAYTAWVMLRLRRRHVSVAH